MAYGTIDMLGNMKMCAHTYTFTAIHNCKTIKLHIYVYILHIPKTIRYFATSYIVISALAELYIDTHIPTHSLHIAAGARDIVCVYS